MLHNALRARFTYRVIESWETDEATYRQLFDESLASLTEKLRQSAPVTLL